MARTTRNITHAGYFRHPHTMSEARAWYALKEESNEWPHLKRILARRAPRRSLPDEWDDKMVAARGEIPACFK